MTEYRGIPNRLQTFSPPFYHAAAAPPNRNPRRRQFAIAWHRKAATADDYGCLMRQHIRFHRRQRIGLLRQ